MDFASTWQQFTFNLFLAICFGISSFLLSRYIKLNKDLPVVKEYWGLNLFFFLCSISYIVKLYSLFFPYGTFFVLVCKNVVLIISIITIFILIKVCFLHSHGSLVQQISKLTSMKEDLRETHERYNLALDAANVGLWDWDIESNQVFISSRLSKILEYQDSKRYINFEFFKSIIHPEDSSRVSNAINNHLNAKIPYDIKYRIKNLLGNYVWVHVKGNALWGKNKIAYRMVGTFHNISDKREIEDKFKEMHDFQELIINSSPDIIFVKDENFRIIRANPAFMSLYPKNKQNSIIGTDTLDDFDKQTIDMITKQDFITLKDGCAEAIETIRYPNGSVKNLNTKKVRFTNYRGENFILAVGRDVTEREILIKKLEKYTKELESRNRDLDEFAHIVSHDLREPLRGIHNYSSFILEDYSSLLNESGRSKLLSLQRLCLRMENC